MYVLTSNWQSKTIWKKWHIDDFIRCLLHFKTTIQCKKWSTISCIDLDKIIYEISPPHPPFHKWFNNLTLNKTLPNHFFIHPLASTSQITHVLHFQNAQYMGNCGLSFSYPWCANYANPLTPFFDTLLSSYQTYVNSWFILMFCV